MKRTTEKQKAILERRSKVAELLVGNTEKEIAVELDVSLRTIVSDVDKIKKSTLEWVNDLPRYIVLHKFKSALSNSGERYKILKNALGNAANIFEIVAVIKEMRAEEEFSTELMGKAPTVYGLKLAMEKANVQPA